MGRFESKINPNSEAFRQNREDHLALIREFRGLEAKIEAHSARALPKFRKRGQLLPRERVNLLLDRGAPFLELSTMCGYQMHDDDGDQSIAGAGICGIGYIAGVRCMISANNSAIRGGALSPMGVDKALRVQQLAMENKLPFVQLIESAGANLFRQAEMFVKGGAAFFNLAKLSAMGIPVIGVTHGSSTAGGAYMRGSATILSSFEADRKYILPALPSSKQPQAKPLLRRNSARGDAHLWPGYGGVSCGGRLGRHSHLSRNHWKIGWNEQVDKRVSSFDGPAYDPEEILGIVPVDYARSYDCREVIARIVDRSDILDFKPNYGPHTVTLQAEIQGHAVGIIANNGPIDPNGATKATQFIQLCCQSNIPLIFCRTRLAISLAKPRKMPVW